MYSLMVVDDEEYAVLGITKGIDWFGIGITRIFEAYGADEALEIFKTETIDVLICDIEMPGCNGIQLLDWVNEYSPETRTIFLTGHANFAYAQKAVQLDCVDYLLKPVDYEELKQGVSGALNMIKKEKEKSYAIERYSKLWEQQKPNLIGHFWQDVLGERISCNVEKFTEAFQVYDMHINISDKILLILIKVEYWLEEMNAREREVKRFTIRSISSEIILDSLEGAVIQDHSGNNLVIIYSHKDINEALLADRCNSFINNCNISLKCHLSCYISEPGAVEDIVKTYRQLLKVEYDNIVIPNSILYQREYIESAKYEIVMPSFSQWTVLLETGRKDELTRNMKDFLESIGCRQATKEMLEAFYYGVIHMIYDVLHKNKILVNKALNMKETVQAGLYINSIQQMRSWAVHIINEAADYLKDFKKCESAIVLEIKNYIEKHIFDDFTLADMANDIHFNQDYMSRVFKKESGTILSDYIVFRRMNMAKKLLEDSSGNISDIAGKLTYSHYSHFSRVFRNIIGVTPQEYRKMYRNAK